MWLNSDNKYVSVAILPLLLLVTSSTYRLVLPPMDAGWCVCGRSAAVKWKFKKGETGVHDMMVTWSELNGAVAHLAAGISSLASEQTLATFYTVVLASVLPCCPPFRFPKACHQHKPLILFLLSHSVFVIPYTKLITTPSFVWHIQSAMVDV
jgi:hypothetical protein